MVDRFAHSSHPRPYPLATFFLVYSPYTYLHYIRPGQTVTNGFSLLKSFKRTPDYNNSAAACCREFCSGVPFQLIISTVCSLFCAPIILFFVPLMAPVKVKKICCSASLHPGSPFIPPITDACVIRQLVLVMSVSDLSIPLPSPSAQDLSMYAIESALRGRSYPASSAKRVPHRPM